MEIIFLSIGVIADSIAIILLWVSHRRGNRRGKGMSYSDIKKSMELSRKIMDWQERANTSANHLCDVYEDIYRRQS